MQFEKWAEVDIAKSKPGVLDIGTCLFTEDNNSFLLGMKLKNNGTAYDVPGSVSGTAIDAMGNTWSFAGEKDGNKAWILLPQSALQAQGKIEIFLRVSDGTDYALVTLYAYGYVKRSKTDAVYQPGTPYPTIETLIGDVEQAAEDAETALAQASAVVSYAAQSGQTDVQKAQARANIGAASEETVTVLSDNVTLPQTGTLNATMSSSTITGASYARLVYAALPDGTKRIKVTKNAGKTFTIGFTSVQPVNGTSVTGQQSNGEGTSIKADVPDGAKYLAVYYFNTNRDTGTDSDMLASISMVGVMCALDSVARETIKIINEETEIVPDTPGYLYHSSFQFELVVEMDATTGKPVMRESPENASNSYRYALIDVSDQVGDMYRFDCAAGGAASPCPVILSADGAVLARHVASQTRLQETWSIPEGAKWLYIVRNIGTSDIFANNRFWHLSVESRIAEEQKAETVTDAFERLAAKIPQTVVWTQGLITPEGSVQSSTVNIRMNTAVTVAQDCVLRVTPSAGYAYMVRHSGEHWPNYRSLTRCLIPLSAGDAYRLVVSRTDGADITPDVGNTAVTIELLVGMPAAPTTDGTYALKATVSNGVPTYGWVSDGTASLMSASLTSAASDPGTEATGETE